MNAIHNTAIISSKAQIGKNVVIGPYSIIHDNVVLHEDVSIGAFCEIGVENNLTSGDPLVIGRGGQIRSHSVFYSGSVFGEHLVTGHRTTVREGTLAGRNLQIGTLSDIQGDCTIGDHVRLHSNVHISKASKIGNFVWIFPYVVLTNDPHPPSDVRLGSIIEDYAVIATMTVILPGIIIARHTLVGAHSLVNADTEESMLYAGSPARKICSASRIRLRDGTRRNAYPWIRHFTRGYPDDVITKWREISDDETRQSNEAL